MRLLAILHVVLFVVVLCCPLVAAQDETLAVGGLKTIRIERNVSATASGCIECHSQQMPALVADWADSRHAHMNITCLDCHAAGPADSDYSKKHLGWEKTRVSPVVSRAIVALPPY